MTAQPSDGGAWAWPAVDREGRVLAWMADAACASSSTPHAWHSDDPDLTTLAIRTCQGCPVREPCLRYALEVEDPAGVWGGLTARQRRAIRRQSSTVTYLR